MSDRQIIAPFYEILWNEGGTTESNDDVRILTRRWEIAFSAYA